MKSQVAFGLLVLLVQWEIISSLPSFGEDFSQIMEAAFANSDTEDDIDQADEEMDFENVFKADFQDVAEQLQDSMVEQGLGDVAEQDDVVEQDDVAEQDDGTVFDEVAFVEEIQKELEKNNEARLSMQSANGRAIKHGDTIALQTSTNYHWLGCAGAYCASAGCPRMYMEGADWKNCWGEVFQIYRAKGPGEVTAGDIVGIYYPREKRWFGCAGNTCGKAPCPGSPSTQYGFQSPDRWQRCWGEVFKIYVRGRDKCDTIQSHDDIFLYYPRGTSFVSQKHSGNTVKSGCPGKALPPPPDKYDHCGAEVFSIVKP